MAARGRIAVVTGASRGLGREIALGLAREGVRVALVGRDARRLKETLEAIASAGGAARSFVVDVSRADVNGRFLFIEEPLQGTLPSW